MAKRDLKRSRVVTGTALPGGTGDLNQKPLAGGHAGNLAQKARSLWQLDEDATLTLDWPIGDSAVDRAGDGNIVCRVDGQFFQPPVDQQRRRLATADFVQH
jgi:hypothetical protein